MGLNAYDTLLRWLWINFIVGGFISEVQHSPDLKVSSCTPPHRTIAFFSLQLQNYNIRAMARLLHRSPSAISLELSRNADASGCSSSKVQKSCQYRLNSARPQRRLQPASSLFCLVQYFFLAHW